MHSVFLRLAVAGLLVAPAGAAARAVYWGGNGINNLGPTSILLKVNNDRVALKNVQIVLSCVDAEDGTRSGGAFDAKSPSRVRMDGQRYAFDFNTSSGGRRGRVRVNGVMRASGTGYAHVRIRATGRGQGGEVVDRCTGEANIDIRGGN